MTTIRQLLDKKGRNVTTISPTETVFRAIEIMAELDIGALVVVENDKPVGIMTERDYARDVILKGRSSRDTAVRDVMVQDFPVARQEDTVEHCMGLMTDKRIRHLPVLDDGRLVGLVSIGDLVKSVIDHQKSTIEQLVGYVRGNS